MASESEYMETSIARQMADVEKQIKELQSEKLALERLLLKARRENVLARDVTRKNSVNRILVETKIFEALRRSSRPVTNAHLYSAAQEAVFNLNENTFRSHIKRLKDAGKIVSHGGQWTLPETEN